MGLLYVVATPIGNLKDLSIRAQEALGEAELIIAEDTRVTSKLLAKFELKKEIISYHQHSGEGVRNKILSLLLLGKTLAMVSDAGTPGVSDPGNELIDYLYQNSINEIIPIPGPSAVIAALSVCGFDVNKYVFIGFMPKKKRTKLFKFLANSELPFVFYDSPHRIIKNLEAIRELIGDRRVFVARELTKMHESLYRGSVIEVVKKLEASTLKGEITVVVEKGK